MAFMIDPPSGWKYGFPKKWDIRKTLEQMLLDAGYPESETQFALKYMRMWQEPEGATNAETSY